MGRFWVSRQGAVILALVLASSPFLGINAFSSPSTGPGDGGEPTPAAAPDASQLSTLSPGPIPLRDELDVGAALGLRDGVLTVDVDRIHYTATAAQLLSLRDRRAPAARPTPEQPSFASFAADEAFGLRPEQQEALLWRDAFLRPGSDDSAYARLLTIFAEASHLEESVARAALAEFGDAASFDAAANDILSGRLIAGERDGAMDRFLDQARDFSAFEVIGDLSYHMSSASRLLERSASYAAVARAAGAPASPAYASLGPQRAAQELKQAMEAGEFSRVARLLERQSAPLGIQHSGTVRIRSDFVVSVEEYTRAIAYPMTPGDLERVQGYAQRLSPEQATFLATIVGGMAEAELLARPAFEGVSASERDLLLGLRQALSVRPNGETGLPAGFEMEEVVRALSHVDWSALWLAAHQATLAVEAAAAAYEAPAQSGAMPPFFQFPDAPDQLFGGYIVQIGTPVADEYTEDAGLNIDLGGDDVYTAAVGGTSMLVEQPIQAAIDVFGDDRYVLDLAYSESALGGGDGVGLFFEFQGDDSYVVDGSFSLALGTGDVGFGLFADYEGNDFYEANLGGDIFTGTAPTLGGGAIGTGVFVDLSGDDIYSTSSVEALGFGVLGAGWFIDAQGDDSYRPTGGGIFCVYYLGAGSLGYGEFHDLAGDDEYEVPAGASCLGAYGCGSLGAGFFSDTAGLDTYVGGATLAGEIKDDSVWVPGGNCLGPGFGVDQGSFVEGSPGLDLVPTIANPSGGFSVAPGGVFDFTLTVRNRGTLDAADVSGRFDILSREDDGSSAQQTHESFPVPFGAIDSGASQSANLTWTAPLEDSPGHVRTLYGVLTLLTPDDRPGSDVDFVDFDVRNVRDARLLRLRVSESGKLPPAVPSPIRADLENRGNMPVTLLVSALVLDENEEPLPEQPDPVEVSVDPRGAIYDGGKDPVTQEVLVPWTTPAQDGRYTVHLSIPADSETNQACAEDPESSLCLAYTTQETVVEIITVIEGTILPYQASAMVDPDLYEGFQFKVLNSGTVPFEGLARVTVFNEHGTPSEFESPVSLAADESTVVAVPPGATPPTSGAVWRFVGELILDNDADETNNHVEYVVRFIPGIIFGDDFEQANPRVTTPECGGTPTEWRRGSPRVDGGTPLDGLEARSGDVVWGTGLGVGTSDDTCHDLIYGQVDFSNYLDPYIEFWSAIDSLGCCGFADSGAVLDAKATDQPGYRRVDDLSPPYPCETSFNSEAGPQICGAQGWTRYRADLASYTGKVVDLRFRYATYFCCNAGYAGWFLDDLSVFGTRRVEADLQALAVLVEPEPLVANQAGTLHVTVRNNGFTARDIPVLVEVREGTRDLVLSQSLLVPSAAPTERVELLIPWTPEKAKKYSIAVRIDDPGDPRQANNQLTHAIDVYDQIVVDDLESLVGPCDTGCGGWEHSAGRPEWDEWRLGTPTDHPGTAYSGNNSWATDLTGPYAQPDCTTTCTDPPNQELLTSPPFEIPPESHEGEEMEGFVSEPGDRYFLSFQHAFDIWEQCAQYWCGNDIVYIVQNKNDEVDRMLTPPEGYTSTTFYNDGFEPCCEPENNEGRMGITGANDGWEPMLLPLNDVAPEDSLRFKFYLYSPLYNFCSPCEHAGWAIDDLQLLRGPRFDQDLESLGPTPRVYDIGSGDPVKVVVRNVGREAASGARVHLRVNVPGPAPITASSELPDIPAGETLVVTFPVQMPRLSGSVPLTASVEWDADEWDRNNNFSHPLRFGRVLYQTDFERDAGGWEEAENNPGFKLGTRSDRSPLQGARSWFTGPLSYSNGATLEGPTLEARDPSGIEMPQMVLTGLVAFDGSDQNRIRCPYSGIRLLDEAEGEILELAPATLTQVGGLSGLGHCGAYDALEFEVDLTARQTESPLVEPVFQVRTGGFQLYCFACNLQENNVGAEVDQIALFGSPHTKNALIRGFTAPTTNILGPGERAKLEVQVASSGLNWPDAPVAVRFTSNDQAFGGAPSLDRVVPIARPLEFAESTLVGTDWLVPPSLADRILRVSARLVVNTGCRCVNVADFTASDNLVDRIFSVVALHDLAIDVRGLPSLDPQNVLTTTLRGQMVNHGTLTEPAAHVTFDVLDESGALVYRVPTSESYTVAPAFAQLPINIESVWVPPSPGHYQLRATVSYAASNEDLHPEDNVALAWIHAGVPAFRYGDTFDEPGERWTASGGSSDVKPFVPRPLAGAPSGSQALSTNPAGELYEPNATYRYDASVSLVGVEAPIALSFVHSYDLGLGDEARVLLSSDEGRTWRLLRPEGGYDGRSTGFQGSSEGWRIPRLDLSAFAGRDIRLRFEAASEVFEEALGWQIDEIEILSTTGRVFYEDFESRFGRVLAHWDFEAAEEDGWTHGADVTELDDWVRGTPKKSSIIGAHSGARAWVTGAEADYADASIGHKLLRSPPLEIPASASGAAATWWQSYAIQYGHSCCFSGASPSVGTTDGAFVGVSVDGGAPIPLTPETGYPVPISPDSGSARGFTGSSGGWERHAVDLSAFAGQTVEFVFDFYVAETDDLCIDCFKSGPADGLAIDDVTVFVDETPAGELSGNLVVQAVDVPMIGDYQESTFEATILNDDSASRAATLAWEWTGAKGAVLGAGTQGIVLEPGASVVTGDLPAVAKPQAAVLRVAVSSPDDPLVGDNELYVAAPVQSILLNTDFEDAGEASAWTHTGEGDEWQWGPIVPEDFPGYAYSGEMVWGMDLRLEDDANLNYLDSANAVLSSPSFTVPAEGGQLRFRHALDAEDFYDGGIVRIGGSKVAPQAGYPKTCWAFGGASCWGAQYGWREDVIDLSPFRGETVTADFVFASDISVTLLGWVIDDVTAMAPMPRATKDVAVTAPPLFTVDARYGGQLEATVSNLGNAPSAPHRVVARAYVDGLPLSEQIFSIPALPQEGRWAIPFDLPEGDVGGLLVRFFLEPRDGAPRDEDPSNDVAETHFKDVHLVYSEPVEDGTMPYQPEADIAAFTIRQSGTGLPAGPSRSVVAAGFGKPLASSSISERTVERILELPSQHIPEHGVLGFDQFYRLGASGETAVIEASRDGGALWQLLVPLGGYPEDSACGLAASGYYSQCFTGALKGWTHVIVPLDAYAGELTRIRFRLHASTEAGDLTGWALDNFRIHGDFVTTAWTGAPRWAGGPVRNPDGPPEALSLPNAWGVGLASSTSRPGAFDAVESPPIDVSRIPNPTLGFDWSGRPEAGAELSVQVLDLGSNWLELGRITSSTAGWEHAEFPLAHVGDTTQLRLVLASSQDPHAGGPGYFIDNVAVGSLSARIERSDILPEVFVALDGKTFTVPVKVTNTGSYTNLYAFTARGPTPYWYGNGTPETILLEPGESRSVDIRVQAPYGGNPGRYDVSLVAQSVYDPLQLSILRVPVDLRVDARPDWFIRNLQMTGMTVDHGVWVVPDASRVSIFADVQNSGDADTVERPRIQFREHILVDPQEGRIDIRSFNSSIIRPTPPGLFRNVFTDWTPRVGVVGLEVIVNGGALIPEKTPLGNTVFQPMRVNPRTLPELILAGPPEFSRLAHQGQATSVGLDVRNVGSTPTRNPIDVAAVAGYEDATLTSPVLMLPGNDVLKIRYVSDLELRVDGIVLEGRSGTGPWTLLEPVGEYPLGCVLALRVPDSFGETAPCRAGISGDTEGQVADLTFNLRPLEGASQVRLRFAMDAHNGRSPEGFTLLGAAITHAAFGQGVRTVRAWDFGLSGYDWSGTHTWTYHAAQGPAPGGWNIPRDYANPYTFGLRSAPVGQCASTCMDVGEIAHIDVDWVPAAGGLVPITVFLDPHEIEPEFIDDLNRYVSTKFVLDSEFTITPARALVLAHAAAEQSFPVTITNGGNHRATFSLSARQHPFFEAEIQWGGRPIPGLVLDAGQSFEAELFLRAVGAPAGPHAVYIEVYDDVSRKAFPFGLEVRVDSGGAAARVVGDLDFRVRQKAAHTVRIENAGNAFLPVVLRISEKPSGLAARIQPDEFTLRPFESRSVEIEFINLGVAAGTYDAALLNAGLCTNPSMCEPLARLNVVVETYDPPVAAFRADALEVGVGSLVRFEDTSRTLGSTAVEWRWSFGDGQEASIQNPVHAFLQPGAYEVRLVVVDADGARDESDAALVVVSNTDPLARPKLTLQGGGVAPTRGVSLNLSAWESVDPDGGIVNVTWAFGDGQIGTGINVTHVYERAGPYRVTVAVEDTFGGVGVGTLDLVVVEPVGADLGAAEAKAESVFAKLPGPGFGFLLVALAAAMLLAFGRRRA